MKNKEILIVIDMLKGFIDQGPLADPSIRRIVPENAVDTFNLPGHDKQSYQQTALGIMKGAGIVVI